MSAPRSLREALNNLSPRIVLPGLYQIGRRPIFVRWEDATHVLVTDLGNVSKQGAPVTLEQYGLSQRDGAVVAVVRLEEVAAAVAAMAAWQGG